MLVRHSSLVSGSFLTRLSQLMDVNMCRWGSFWQTGLYFLDDANMDLALLIPPLSVQVLHGNNLHLRNRRASQHERFMCCEIDCMRWLMLHPSAAAVWMDTFSLCLKRQFKGFRKVTAFISFVCRITLLRSPLMDVFGFFFPSFTVTTAESRETILVGL